MAGHGGPLAADVSAFIDGVCAELAGVSGKLPAELAPDVTIEASNLVAAIVDADGRLADAELSAFIDSVGVLLDPPVIVTPSRLREGGMLQGRRDWLLGPSVLFQLLVDADARDRTRRSHRYYALALALAHSVAAIDLLPSPAELAAIDSFRSLLLHTLDSAGVARPGAREQSPTSSPPVASTAVPSTKATTTQPPEPVPHEEVVPARTLEELLAELDALIGLDHVKREVRQLTSLLRVQQLRAERGLPTFETSHHLVFSGNPGTGKTTIARMLSQIYRALGIVSKGHFVETDRSHLVAGFVGQTAIRTREALESGLGGTVLIDEAYALARGGENDFGLEAIDTLVKFMEDHRADLAIVAAGYTNEMATFIDANPGLASRFTRTVVFPDYTDDELVAIFVSLGEANSYEPSDGALAKVRHLIAVAPRGRGFGNARYVRNLFEAAVAHHALRVAPLDEPIDEQLTTLTADDIAEV